MKALRALPLLLCLASPTHQTGCLGSLDKQTVYTIPGPVPSAVTICENETANLVVIVETSPTRALSSERANMIDAKRSKAAAFKALARHLGATAPDSLAVSGLVELDVVEANGKLTTTYRVPRSGCRVNEAETKTP